MGSGPQPLGSLGSTVPMRLSADAPEISPGTDADVAIRREVRLLDPHTINQIAAGEVVERPAAALKELIENALDAGATRVQIQIQDAGRSLIRISDNGHGMDAATAWLALERHATSKITAVGDLANVATLGFRGEALPSIASVSHLELETGCGDGVRHVIDVLYGDRSEAKATGGPAGTTITVRDLFLRTPARLKFLKSDATELSACAEVVMRYALAYPAVAFLMRNGESVAVQTSGSGELITAIAEVWGRDVARSLVPVDFFNGSVAVTGYASPPHFTRATRSQQWVTVNGRPVRARMVFAALDQAYRSLTPDRRYPVVLLDLALDPARLDVNVSPTKSEVKFHQEGSVFDGIRRGVQGALLSHGMVPSAEGLLAANDALQQARGGPVPVAGLVGASVASLFATAVGDRSVEGSAMAALALAGGLATESSTPEPESERISDLLDGLRILAQIDETFILAENASSLLIVDQHVAHERILYEQLAATRGSGMVERQRLLTPETLHTDRRSAERLQERLEDLALIGFELEPFGSDSFLVRSVPALLRVRKPLEILRDLVDEIADGEASVLTPARDEVYIMAACKMAIKAGDRLGHAEMEKLLVDLAATENPYLCPHGRPITIVLRKSDLLRKFKR